MDAFVLAGDRGQSRKVRGVNKAFLMLDGRPLFLHVLVALSGARAIARIYIIGPKRQIEAAIAASPPNTASSKWIVLEQKQTLLENALWAYDISLQDRTGQDRTGQDDPPALFLSADIPLVTTQEIESFIAQADMDQADYCLGVTPDHCLAPFYPAPHRPGIRMAYLYLRDRAYRISNLHLVRPHRIGAVEYIQRAYDVRHQKQVTNLLKTLWALFRASSWFSGVRLYLLARCAGWFSKMGIAFLAAACRNLLPACAVEATLSRFLQARVRMVEVNMGGSAIDVDDDATYATLSLRYAEWRNGMMRGASAYVAIRPVVPIASALRRSKIGESPSR